MRKTTEAMKQAHAVLQSGALLCEVTAASILREAIATEQANNGLLAGKLELMTSERDKLLLELGDLRALRTALPAPPPDDHIGDAAEMVPMTDQELDDLLPTNDSMSRKDSQRWIARATERHHKIGVKQ